MQELTHREILHCIQTAFTILSGQGAALNIDPTCFYTHMYQVLLNIHAGICGKIQNKLKFWANDTDLWIFILIILWPFYFWCCNILKNDEGKVRKPKQPHFFLFLTSCCVCTYSKLIVIEGLYNILQYLVFVVYHELQQWDWHMFYVSRQFTRGCWSCFSLCGCDDHAT